MTATTITPRRPASREIDARVGMAIFLASWGMTFATLFFACSVLRVQSPSWPPPGVEPLPASARIAAWINTALLVAGSVSLHRGVRSIDRGSARRLHLFLAGALACGTAFLAIQLHTWLDLFRSGMRMQDGTYQGLFWAITTFHGLHVLAGLVILVWALPSAAALAAGRSSAGAAPGAADSAPARERIRVRSAAAFWHFVDLAWIGTLLVVYLA